MQEYTYATDKEINHSLLRGVLGMPKWWLGAVGFLGLVWLTGVGAYGWELNQGVGVLGVNRPVYWGFLITNFVFWIGISHAGIMVSAILRLTQAEWRRPVTPAAEGQTKLSQLSPHSNNKLQARRPGGR